MFYLEQKSLLIYLKQRPARGERTRRRKQTVMDGLVNPKIFLPCAERISSCLSSTSISSSTYPKHTNQYHITRNTLKHEGENRINKLFISTILFNFLCLCFLIRRRPSCSPLQCCLTSTKLSSRRQKPAFSWPVFIYTYLSFVLP